MQMQQQLRIESIQNLVIYSKAYAETNCSIMSTSVNRVNPYADGMGIVDTCYASPPTNTNTSVDIECPLYAYCSYQCTLCMVISPLMSGYALDVHGQMLITQANQFGSNGNGIGTSIIYKAIDTGVTCSVINT